MKINVEYIDGEDLGEPNWRVSVKFHTGENKIIVETRNFEHGLRDGEDWDKISTFNTYEDGSYENYVSIITKNKRTLKPYKKLVVHELYSVFEYNIEIQHETIKSETQWLEKLEAAKKCGLYRYKKIDEILENAK